MHDVASARTSIESEFDSEATKRLKASVAADISIGGPELAAEALRASLVDELHLFLVPVALGAGKPALPANLRLELSLVDERRFESGVTYLRYDAKYS